MKNKMSKDKFEKLKILADSIKLKESKKIKKKKIENEEIIKRVKELSTINRAYDSPIFKILPNEGKIEVCPVCGDCVDEYRVIHREGIFIPTMYTLCQCRREECWYEWGMIQ